MNQAVVEFLKEAFERYPGLEATYLPDSDCYSVTFRGRAVQNFTLQDFYTFPRRQRMREYEAIIKVGLSTNLAGYLRDQVYVNRRNGIVISL